jgi:hypothetical protein
VPYRVVHDLDSFILTLDLWGLLKPGIHAAGLRSDA